MTVETRNATIENPSVPVSAENFLAFFGLQSANLPNVTVDAALRVPAVLSAVAFLSRTMAAVPRHAYRRTKDGSVRLTGKLQTIIHENPNPHMDAFKFWQYFWQCVFTGGRGLAWIEWNGNNVEAFWPMIPTKTSIKRVGFKLVYRHDGREYPAEDVIDIPFMLRADMLSHYGPITLAAKAIQLALAMNDYGSAFFAGGGVPPLALAGPLPAGADGLQRAMDDMRRAIDGAKKNGKQIFPIPPGHEIKQVGFDPEKGQMTEARVFQLQEIARGWQLPPVFLQDFSQGIKANVEQQDLHLVKHLIGQWAAALEGEMNLKIFGRFNNGRYVEHNLDALMRGDFKSRIEGIARGLQTSQLTANEARALEGRPRHENPAADELLVQGATVVLGSVTNAAPGPKIDPVPAQPGDGDENDAEA